MAAIWIAHTRPESSAAEESLLAFLQSTHADELREGIPEITSYDHHRELREDGGVRFLSVGSCPTLTAAELRERIGALGPQLTPLPGVSLAPGEEPFLVFADAV